MDYSKLSDFEINKLVAERAGLGMDNGYGFVDSNSNLVCYDVILDAECEARAIEVRVNYCNNPSDAWPIIVDNTIDIEFADEKLGGVGQASKYIEGDTDIFCEFNDNNKALRAAMTVYLMMQEDK